MKQKIINWKIISKKDKSLFKKFLKSNFLYKKQFYTNFFNINKEVGLEKKTIEFLVFNLFERDNFYYDAINDEEIKKISKYSSTFNEFITNIFKYSVEPKLQNLFEEFAKVVLKMIDSIYKSHILSKENVKSQVKEITEIVQWDKAPRKKATSNNEQKIISNNDYSLYYDYVSIVKKLDAQNFENYNLWIMFVNKFFYDKGKGFFKNIIE